VAAGRHRRTGLRRGNAKSTGQLALAGSRALEFNTSGSGNTATGFEALRSNTTGSNNSALPR